jgi:hypothetical protein
MLLGSGLGYLACLAVSVLLLGQVWAPGLPRPGRPRRRPGRGDVASPGTGPGEFHAGAGGVRTWG